MKLHSLPISIFEEGIGPYQDNSKNLLPKLAKETKAGGDFFSNLEKDRSLKAEGSYFATNI